MHVACPKCGKFNVHKELLDPSHLEYTISPCKWCGFDWSQAAFARLDFKNRMSAYEIRSGLRTG